MRTLELDRITNCRLSARYASANVRTWIGFKQFMYLVEEAVLTWFRQRDLGPQHIYHEYGAGLEIVDSSVLLPAVLEIDDQVDARVEWLGRGRFGVRLTVARGAEPVTVLRGKVKVALVTERTAPDGAIGAAMPEFLTPLVVPDVAAIAGPVLPSPTNEPFNWNWRARYFHCHFSDRVQHGSYVAALEEVVDRFLADRGLSVPRLLAERGWIPVVSRARVRLLADAVMDEEIQTSFTVTDVFKNRAFDGRMDSHVTSPQRPPHAARHVATAQILHGYAVSRGEFAGSLAELDPQTVEALTAEAS